MIQHFGGRATQAADDVRLTSASPEIEPPAKMFQSLSFGESSADWTLSNHPAGRKNLTRLAGEETRESRRR